MIGQARRRWRSGVSLIAAALLVLAAAPAALGADRVYWANGNNTLSYANLDGSGAAPLNVDGATPNGPRGVDIDHAAGRIYWANQGNDTISHANLDGSGGGDELDIPAGVTIVKPHGVAIDPATRRIYWANDTGNAISWVSLDGSTGGQLDTDGANPAGPYGVAIDHAAGRIYWANRDTHTISYANLDGSGGGDELNTAGATVNKPHGVTIDPEARRIYWTNVDSAIYYANLDGSGGGGPLNISGGDPHGPVGMAIDPTAGLIYWANLGTGWAISFASLDGSGAGGKVNIAGSGSSQPRFLALLRAPSGTGAPAISGASAIGSVLSCSLGSWASDLPDAFLYRAPKTFAYQWSRDGADIAGATTSLYTVFAPGDYRCRVTASDEAGPTSQTSAPLTVAATGGGGAGIATLPPARASFAGSRSVIPVNRGGVFVFSFRATRDLTGRASFVSAGKIRVSRRNKGKRRATFARRSFTVRPNGRVTLRIRLSRMNFRILTMNRRISTRVTVILRNAAGRTSLSSRTITLEAPPPLQR